MPPRLVFKTLGLRGFFPRCGVVHSQLSRPSLTVDPVSVARLLTRFRQLKIPAYTQPLSYPSGIFWHRNETLLGSLIEGMRRVIFKDWPHYIIALLLTAQQGRGSKLLKAQNMGLPKVSDYTTENYLPKFNFSPLVPLTRA